MNRRELFQALVKKTGCKTVETIRREIFNQTGKNFEFEQFRNYFACHCDSKEIEETCLKFLKREKTTRITPITPVHVVFGKEFSSHEFTIIKKSLSILRSKGLKVDVCRE